MAKRRFCVDNEVLSDKSLSYEVYGKLQLESEFKGKGESRMIKFNATERREFLKEIDNMSESTWKRKISALEKKGLIKKIKANEFELPEYGKTYFLIPEHTIAHLLTTATADVIKVYAYLGRKYSKTSNCLFTKTELVSILGWTATNRKKTFPKIDSILGCLIDARLIEIDQINISGKVDGSRFVLKKFSVNYVKNDVLKVKK